MAKNNTNPSAPSQFASIKNILNTGVYPFKIVLQEKTAEYSITALAYKNGVETGSILEIKSCIYGTISGLNCILKAPGYVDMNITVTGNQLTLCETQSGFCTTETDCLTYPEPTVAPGLGCPAVCCKIPPENRQNTVSGVVRVNYNRNNIIFADIYVAISHLDGNNLRSYSIRDLVRNAEPDTDIPYLFTNLDLRFRYKISVQAFDRRGALINLANYRVDRCQGPQAQIIDNFCRTLAPGEANFSFTIPSGCSKVDGTVGPENSTACHVDVWGPIIGGGNSSCGLSYTCLNNNWTKNTGVNPSCGSASDCPFGGLGAYRGNTGLTNEEFTVKIDQWANGNINAAGMSKFITNLCRVPGLQKQTCDPTKNECQRFVPVCSTNLPGIF